RDRVAPVAAPANVDGGGEAGELWRGGAAAHQGAEQAVDQPARAAVEQREDGGDGGMWRGVEGERLDQGDSEREARLGVVGEALLGGAVDQCVEVAEPPQGLG